MNKRKIKVIIHVTDKKSFANLAASLEKVRVPDDFSVEVQPVTGDEKFFAYETARQSSDAKYKIYLDERATVTNENFLAELLKIFSDEQIGLIGTSGAIQLSTHGISLTSFKRTDENFSGEVDAVDGFFIATQHDLPWRIDFTDNFFGVQAQCVEFRRAGYKVFVPKQNRPWISIRGEEFQIDEAARQKFLDEYSADLFPLVSVIIPTFNRPKYFREALDSALSQTYRNIEVFISDNSTDDATENFMQEYLARDVRIKYFRHKDFDADDNWNFARSYNNPSAEFVNWLMDDDKFYPTKLEKMVEFYRNNPDVTLVTSARDFIDENGKIISNTQNVFGKNVKLPGNEAGKLLFTYLNYIGEPTTVLIRKKFLRNNDLCCNADETGFFSLVDLSTWLHLLKQGNMFRFIECLSALRTHAQQMTYSKKIYKRAPYDYAKLLKQVWEEKFFMTNEVDFKISVTGLLWESSKRLNGTYKAGIYDENVELLEKTVTALAQSLTNGCKIDLPKILSEID